MISCDSRASAQSADSVLTAVNPDVVVALAGHHPSWARPQADSGTVPADLRLEHLTLLLARPLRIQQAFEQFLRNQQDPASKDYHHWLTPREVGERFGVSPHDLAAITAWLQSQNLRVDSVADSRVRIRFSGAAGAVGKAFGGEMRYFSVNGKKRISLANAPQIPAALAPVVQAIHGLYTVEARPLHGKAVRPLAHQSARPNLTLGPGENFVVPADFATIYDVPANLTGAGQTIAIIGRSRVFNADVENFQFLFGLPIQDPTVIIPPDGIDPGPPQTFPPGDNNPSGDQGEATIDVTRAGSIATGATIDLVVSASSFTADGITIAASYAVETTPLLAHVMSLSFGDCEGNEGAAGVAYWDNLFSQAAAEGISVFVASGDSGAAGCDISFQTPPSDQALNPNYICSSSYATCVGGTEFNDTANPNLYWSPNNGLTGGSALSYIPEGGWNEPFTSDPANPYEAAASGGGVSSYVATPYWQTGPGVPIARAGRYTPDVSFSAADHDGYVGCFTAAGGDCVNFFLVFFGTSTSAQDMAGIAALLNQKLGSPQGNLNPTLYKLAASPNSIFHDVTLASSGVSPCDINTPSICNNSTPAPLTLTEGLAGYPVGTGYDEVTGLGSLDVGHFVNSWSTLGVNTATTATSITSTANPSLLGTAVTFTAHVTTTGANPPTGSVNFLDASDTIGVGALNGAGVASYTTSSLPPGQHEITAVYVGDPNNPGSSSTTLTQTILATNPVPLLTSMTPSSANAGSGALVLTLTGANFMPGSQVLWNGAALATTYFSGGTELQATIPAANTNAAGTASVSVGNPAPGGVSGALTFSILESGAGTGGFLSMFVSGSNLGNSMLFQSGGLVGVGTTAPIRTLDVNGEIQARGGNLFLQRNLTDLAGRRNWAWGTETANVGDMAFFVSTSNNNFPSKNVMTLLSNGNVGIGPIASTPVTTLQVGGDIRVGTTDTNGCLQNFAGTALAGTCSSDARMKSNIMPFAPLLDRLVKLQPVHFEWNREQYPDYHFGAGRSSGLIAQEVEKVFPEMVMVDTNGFKMVNYSELPYLTLAAIRELKTENDSLRAQLAERQRELEELRKEMETRLARLEKSQPRARHAKSRARAGSKPPATPAVKTPSP